ncbi:hypothetical protein D9758_016754 [Tetrapyrgos nigripes]|uniref:Uncharacterized protein n=1 Tax=Tetrapyrgos nigripes TaxID=182062 RepID=A0A8H5CDW2_9AGAR|nr:hypothetical protein D9758_016754 [Tetrapyrgos nigripes]
MEVSLADAKENEKTKAVWARDTLDLDQAAYELDSLRLDFMRSGLFLLPAEIVLRPLSFFFGLVWFGGLLFGFIPKPKLQDLDKPWEKLTPLIPGNEFLTEMKTGAGADGDAGGAAADAAADTTTTLPTSLPPLHLRPPLTLATPLAPRLALTLTTAAAAVPSSFPASASEEKGLHPTIYLANTPTPTTYYPNANTSPPTPTPYTHSPLTILLLDDYPLKARLQPYTRFCIPEYSRDVWVMRVLSGAEGDKGGKGGNGGNGGKGDGEGKGAGVPLWSWSWVANLQQVQEREREEGRGIQATDGPTEIEIPTDEDAVIEDVVANTSTYTSTDSIVVPIAPTVPNSPAAAKKLKRKRTLNDMGFTADILTTASTASTSTSLVKGGFLQTSTPTPTLASFFKKPNLLYLICRFRQILDPLRL